VKRAIKRKAKNTHLYSSPCFIGWLPRLCSRYMTLMVRGVLMDRKCSKRTYGYEFKSVDDEDGGAKKRRKCKLVHFRRSIIE